MKTQRLLSTVLLAALASLTPACSKKSADAHADHDHQSHAHAAPHGGTLVEIGDHQYNLEFVADRATGTLTVYVLDAHAENFLRLPLPSLAVTVNVHSQIHPLPLLATANAATGETVGDTSQFTASADFLKTNAELNVTVASLVIRAQVFYGLTARLPAAK